MNEREAREEAVSKARNTMYKTLGACDCYDKGYSCVKCDKAVDTYRASVLAGVREEVGKMDGPMVPKSRMPEDGDVFVERSRVLAMLDRLSGAP